MAAEILLVEDRESLRSMLAETLAGEGWGVEVTASSKNISGKDASHRAREPSSHRFSSTAVRSSGVFSAHGPASKS